MLKSKKFTITQPSQQKRFDVACAAIFPEISRKKIKTIIDNGGAYINKKRVKVAKAFLTIGDTVELYWDDKQKDSIQITKESVVFENEDFIILDKPAGIAVQGTLDTDKTTILHALHKFYPKKYPFHAMYLVHRLDKETSGLMIIAKKQETQKVFEEMFRNHEIYKTYKALCYFTPKEKQGVVKYPIAKDIARKNTYFAVVTNKQYPSQKAAETEYTVEKIYKNGVTLVSCTPKTGRTHQIRVHLGAIGAPILGDKTYAQNIYAHPHGRGVLRQMLHASDLKFKFDNEDFEFNVKLPDDFSKIIKPAS